MDSFDQRRDEREDSQGDYFAPCDYDDGSEDSYEIHRTYQAVLKTVKAAPKNYTLPDTDTDLPMVNELD